MEEPVAPEDPDALQKQAAWEALGENPTTWAKASLNDVVAEGTEVDVGTRDMSSHSSIIGWRVKRC